MSRARLASLLLLILATPAAATVATDLCLPSASPCVIDASAVITGGSTLDFGDRPVILKAGRKLDVGGGTMTIIARSLTLEPTAGLFGRGATDATGAFGGTIDVRASEDVRLQSSNAGRARIDVSADQFSGSITIIAGGNVEINGVIAAQSTTSDGSAGSVEVTATNGGTTVGPKGSITASGGSLGDGGDVTLVSGGGVVMSGPVDCHAGGDGGSIVIQSGDALSTTSGGELDVRTTAEFGSGGSVSLMSLRGNLVIDGRITGEGTGSSADGGSTGGDISLTAAGDVTVRALLNVAGASPDGEGGTVDVVAGRDVILSDTLQLHGRGAQGTGGDVTVDARRDATLGPIDVGGGLLGGGTVSAKAAGTLTVPETIDADGGGGSGGIVSLVAETLAVSGEVHVGGPAGGSGGRTDATACTLTLAGTGMLAARPGAGGSNTLRASGQMSLFAGSAVLAGALNRLEYRPGKPPITAGTIDPVPQLVENASLRRCAGEVPPNCGNGTLDPGEDCDDGNLQKCDGCSDVCTLEVGLVCGDGVLNTACGEQCDDGNTIGCDGCAADCKRADNVCGDGARECGEQCDDANTTSCDHCSALCRTDNVCGDAVVECGEECDEGTANNGKPGGTCDATCHLRPLPTCGDGHRDPGEECDLGPNGCNGCSATCHIEICGNNVIDCHEDCDDGNRSSCDGCSTVCLQERCGNNVVDCGEECDDGNTVNGDACDENCTRPACGNGVRSPSEQCDDGNQNSGDGCDALCRIETPCPLGIPGFCTACTADSDCNDLGPCTGCIEHACVVATPLDCTDDRSDTLDVCVVDATGVAGCRHDCAQASACDDGNRCNGAEACTGGKCVASAPLDCDDHDVCTADTCAPATGCQHAVTPGFVGIDCRLKAIDTAMLAAAPTDVTTATRRKISKARLAAGAKLNAALAAEQVKNAKRERKTLIAAQKRIASLERLVGSAQLKSRISDALADEILLRTGGAGEAVANLLAGLATSAR